ncbi:hypothetical protein [Ruegeria intermedia]|uniref:hypothetical protein n=1 Tax=Ruegeria intermedia TaxID=996115 RepID=UPI00165F408E|nr:hypothetical protein [Ruegeria intermedia]
MPGDMTMSQHAQIWPEKKSEHLDWLETFAGPASPSFRSEHQDPTAHIRFRRGSFLIDQSITNPIPVICRAFLSPNVKNCRFFRDSARLNIRSLWAGVAQIGTKRQHSGRRISTCTISTKSMAWRLIGTAG